MFGERMHFRNLRRTLLYIAQLSKETILRFVDAHATIVTIVVSQTEIEFDLRLTTPFARPSLLRAAQALPT